MCWAAQRSGLVFVPINWHLTPAEVHYVVESSGSQALVAGAAFAATATALAASLPALRVRLALGGGIPGYDDLDEVLAAQPGGELHDEQEGSEMIYSSGTTGRPKGGFRPPTGAHPSETDPTRYRIVQLLGLRTDMRYLTPGAPLYHAAPLRYSMRATRLGATNVLMPRFDPEGALAAIEELGVTHSQWVPTMFVRLLRLPDEVKGAYDLSSHETAFHAGAPCAPSVKRAMLEWWGPIVHEYYGGSEGGLITYIGPHEWLEHPGSVGRPIVGTAHIVSEEDGTELGPGEPGLVYAEDGAPVDYHGDPDKTRAAHDEHGWVTIGDIGYLDDEGFLFLTDRKDNTIISGGVNIYPREIEDVLVGHPLVADVAVFGVPNDDLGEEVKAVVELVDPADASDETEEILLEHCRASIARFKCPRSVDFATSLPRAPSGKLYKRRLRDPYWEGRESSLV